jgi:alpha-glucosidase (family GH31 glycosyl hydrolase)
MRYEMLPYNYTLAFENNRTGVPLMRPMFFEEPDNTAAYTTSSQYLWGNDFLVAPVFEAAAATKTVYFPKTANWYHLHNGSKYAGGSSHTIKLSPDHIPVFVRGGAIVPFIQAISSTAHYNKSELSFHYFYDADCRNSAGTFYDDDGYTPNAYENGAAALYQLQATQNEKTIKLDIHAETGAHYKARRKKARFVINHIQKPRQVLLNGKKCPYLFKDAGNIIEVPFKLNPKQKTQLQILF